MHQTKKTRNTKLFLKCESLADALFEIHGIEMNFKYIFLVLKILKHDISPIRLCFGEHSLTTLVRL